MDPLILNYLAQVYEAIGVQRVYTLDAHNPAAFENAFRCISANLEAAPVFANYLCQHTHEGSLVVMSPDIGGIKRAEKFRRLLETTLEREVGMAFLEKYREESGLLGSTIVGDVGGANVLIYDDLISTGKTVLRASEVLHQKKARSVSVLSSHGLFSENKERLLKSDLVDEIVVTNSNPSVLSDDFKVFPKLKVISCVPILASVFRDNGL